MQDEPKSFVPVTASTVSMLTEASRQFSSHLDWALPRLEHRGISEEVASTFGLGVVPNDPMPGFEQYVGKLAIPYKVRDDVVQIRFRCLSGMASDGDNGHSCKEYGHSKYLTMAGDSARMYNVNAVRDADDTIHLAEGECLRGDAEVLTRDGWVRFDQYEDQEVAQYDMDGALSFVTPIAFIEKDYSGELIEYSNRQRYYSLTTPKHRMPAFNPKAKRVENVYRFVAAEDGGVQGTYIPRAGRLNGKGTGYSLDELALAIAISADASIRIPGEGKWQYRAPYVVFGFKKERKIERLHAILNRLGVRYSSNTIADGYQSICFHLEGRIANFGRILPFELLTSATTEELEFMLSELRYWDGNGVPNRNQEEYSSKYIENAQWVQTLCHLTGRVSTIMPRSNEHGEWFKVSILHSRSSTSWQSLRHGTSVQHVGKVYCVKVPSGAFIVRMNGCVSITGNCDAIVLNMLGYPAVALPGATQWQWRHTILLSGFNHIYIWSDPDEAGAEMRNEVMRHLPRATPVTLTLGDVGETYMAMGEMGIEMALDTAKAIG